MNRMLALFCILFAVPLAAQDTTGAGTVVGVVASESGTPYANVKVCLEGSGRCANTDVTGRFRIDQLRPASYRLRIEAGTQLTLESVDVRPGIETQVQVALPDLQASRESVTVTAGPSVAPEEIKNSAFLTDGTQIFKSAGTLQDVSRYIQALPGAAIGSDDFRNDIVVRGGSPLENLFIVDNVEIPNINAFANFASAGGTVSILDPNLIRDVTFITGGYPAPFGNRTSSVLQITQREGERDRVHGRLNLLFGGGGGSFEGPLAKGKGSWIVSARRSFLDLFTKDTGIGGVPVLYTLNGKATYDLTPKDRIWLVNLTGFDRIRLGLTESNRNDLDGELNTYDIRYTGQRSATGFNWQRLFGSRAVGLLGLTHSFASVDSTVKDIFRGGLTGGSVDDLIARSPQVFGENSREDESTVKYDLTMYMPVAGRVQAGGNWKFFRTRYNASSPFGNDTPYSTVPGIASFALNRTLLTQQQAAYLQTTRSLGRLNVTVGARADHYSYLASTRVSPRAGVSFRLTDRLTWSGSYGQYFQQPFLFFLAAFNENRGLVPFRADHYVTGFRYALGSGLALKTEVYRKTYKDYPSARDLPQLSVANLGDTFNVREILFPLVSAGRGRSQGLEISIEKTGPGRWFGQANFGVFNTTHAGVDGIQRPGSFDYPRVFNAIGGYRLSRKWELATRVSYLSGRPYTPFDTALSTAQHRGVYDLARINQVRLPDYFRLDIRADRTFYVKDRQILLFLGVQNVTNRQQAFDYRWNRKTSSVEASEQMGIFPLVGFEWRF